MSKLHKDVEKIVNEWDTKFSRLGLEPLLICQLREALDKHEKRKRKSTKSVDDSPFDLIIRCSDETEKAVS